MDKYKRYLTMLLFYDTETKSKLELITGTLLVYSDSE